MEIQPVRAVMTYKVNHVLRARTRTALADLIRRHDDVQVKALMNTPTARRHHDSSVGSPNNARGAWASRRRRT